MRLVQIFIVLIVGSFLVSMMLDRPAMTSRTNSANTTTSTPTLTPVPTITTNIIKYGDNEFRYEVEALTDLTKVKLVYNYEQKTSVEELARVNNCRAGANGGFYDTDNEPLGLVIVDGKKLKGYRKNDLFNGVASIDMDDNFYITNTPIEVKVKYAVQSGPMLMNKGKALQLSLKSDELARRVVVANTADKKKLLLLVFFMDESPLSGPYLEDLPIIVSKLNKVGSLGISEALNMDGGSASAFRNEGIKLNEWVSVGSWWCAV